MSLVRATVRVGAPIAAALFIAGFSIPAAWASPSAPPPPHPGPAPSPGVKGDDCTRTHGRIVFDDPRNTRGQRHCEGGQWNGRKIN